MAEPQIHQVMVTAAPGDAVTNAVFELRTLLRRFGKSEIFACNVHHELLGDVMPLAEYGSYRPADPDPVTIVHVSIGDDQLLPFLAEVRGRFVLSYHNVTPSQYFAPWDPPMARLLDAGRRSLELLRDRTVLALADSSFNAAELTAVGYRDVEVGGLILDLDRMLDIAPAAPPSAGAGGPLVLSVGQVYPHKRPDLLVAAFHELLTRFRPDARLVLAGSHRLPDYTAAVTRYVDRLGIGPRVTITGHISDAEMVGWFRSADIFAIASEHEGFCVPLVEAMLFGVPVVARANGAVPETLGGVGVLLPGDAGPTAMATAIHETLGDDAAMQVMRALGRHRQETAFSLEACRKQVLDALARHGLVEPA